VPCRRAEVFFDLPGVGGGEAVQGPTVLGRRGPVASLPALQEAEQTTSLLLDRDPLGFGKDYVKGLRVVEHGRLPHHFV
jgi:hypothetical protein